jgi:predicted DNA-binding protein (UPF0251 family)
MPPPRRGRRRGRRRISREPHVTYFGPPGGPRDAPGSVVLTYAELEAIRLTDLEGLSQEEAATRMGISRRTFYSDLKSARVKVATALVKGLPIRIEGGEYERRGRWGNRGD